MIQKFLWVFIRGVIRVYDVEGLDFEFLQQLQAEGVSQNVVGLLQAEIHKKQEMLRTA